MEKLLLLHGALGSKSQMEPLAHLLDANFHADSINFAGHGREPLIGGAFGIELFAQNVLDYLDENEIESIDIFGYSMGGYVALYLAKHHPNRVDKIATLGTKFYWTAEGAQQEVKMLNADKIEEKVPAFANVLKQQHGETEWRSLLLNTADMMLGLGSAPLLSDADMAALEHQVMVGVGDGDHMAGVNDSIRLFQQIPNGQLLVMPNTPHPFEKVNHKILAEFLERFFA